MSNLQSEDYKAQIEAMGRVMRQLAEALENAMTMASQRLTPIAQVAARR